MSCSVIVGPCNDGVNTPNQLIRPPQLTALAVWNQRNAVQAGALIDVVRRQNLACPRCHQTHLYRDGKANNLQRYRCAACSRSFNGLTGTPLARLRLKGRWLAYCDCLRDPAATVGSAAIQTGVHPNTSFRWRHRFLTWIKHDRPVSLHGLVALQIAPMRESCKGKRQALLRARTARYRRQGVTAKHRLVKVIVARDEAGRTFDFVARRGNSTTRLLHTQLLPRLMRDARLLGKPGAHLSRFALQLRLAHYTFGARPAEDAVAKSTMKNATRYVDRFRQWLAHFNGVASHYLCNYLGWRWAIDKQRIDSALHFLRSALGIRTYSRLNE